MLRYTLGRLISTIPVLFGVTLLVFAMTALTPGDPVIALLGESAQGVSSETIAELRTQLGLDKPIGQQYLDYMSRLFRGDLGTSLRSGRQVTTEIADRLPATAQLAFAGMALAVVLGLSLGILAAVRRGGVVDVLAIVVALAGVSVPVFWSGFLLMMLFSLELGWFPASGSGSWRHLVLPAVTIGLSSAAFIARITRSTMLESLRRDYVRTAKAKGVPGQRVVMLHALKNAMLPIITVVGLQLGGLLGGAVLTETVFAWPGAGRMLVDAIVARDLPLDRKSVV